MAAFDPKTVGDVLSASPKLRQRRAPSWYDWRDAVGSKIATRSKPWAVEHSTLVVIVTSSAWAQELSLLQSTVLDRLRGQFPQLRRLRCRVGKFTPPAAPQPRHRVLPVALPAALERRLEQIEDETLRDSIRKAAGLSLARRTERG